MGNRLVFLDMDGVMNTDSWLRGIDWKSEKSAGDIRYGSDPDAIDLHWWSLMVDPTKVTLLNDLTDRTGAQIVMSSSWRAGIGLGGARALFEILGVKAPLIDVAPSSRGFGRGAEICEWLVGHFSDDPGSLSNEAIVILDDNVHDMRDVRSRAVQTSPKKGLTPRHSLVAQRFLETPIGDRLAHRIVGLVGEMRAISSIGGGSFSKGAA